MTATLQVTRGTVLQATAGQGGTDSGTGSYDGRAGTDSAGGVTGEVTLSREATLAERGYVHARFGGVPVLVGPALAAQLRTIGQKQPRREVSAQAA